MSDNFEKKLHEIIRINHAGEMGAKVIYSGQIAAIKLRRDLETLELVQHMKKQEDVHFDYFDDAMKREKVRPTFMQPVWKIGGFALGFLTAIAGKKAAMTCTTAVEEVIDEHYKQQIKFLDGEKNNTAIPTGLKEKIEKFRAEELEHRNIGYNHQAADFVAFMPLSSFIKLTTKFAINVSKRF